MLGPLRIIAPFATLTAGKSQAESRTAALRAIGLATLTVLLASLLGSAILVKWHVAVGELAVAGGIVFFLVALQIVLDPYSRNTSTSEATIQARSSTSELVRKLVPIIVTPWGIAAVMSIPFSSTPETRLAAWFRSENGSRSTGPQRPHQSSPTQRRTVRAT